MRKWSFTYELIKFPLDIWHYFFYRKITIVDKQNIPKDRPIIFAPNHQNALMDALAVIFTSRMQPVFLARSDIFKNPIIASILHTFRIYPVYRIRDGASSLDKNEEIFNKSVKILEYKKAMAIFPEAAHTEFRRLRKLKKGIPRVAFIAEKQNDYKLGVEVIPVGIYYSEYQNYKTDLVVKFGKPIPVSDYIETFKENEQKGMAALRAKMEDEIKKYIVHIKSEEHYDFYEQIRELCDYSLMDKLNVINSPENKLLADQKVIGLLEEIETTNPELFIELKDETTIYFNKLKSFGIEDRQFDSETSINKLIGIGILFAFSLPIHIVGVILNYILYKFIESFVEKKIKDTQFKSSIRYGMSLILFILWGIILGTIFSFLIEINFAFFIMFFGVFVTGIFTLRNWFLFKKHIANWRFFKFKKRNQSEFDSLKNSRNKIVQTILEF